MKLLICSDIHGDLDAARKIVDAFSENACDKLLILGDVLYHGPRNDLPKNYSPKGVIELLNPLSEKIISVRGNCDAEVDDMVLTFPVLIKHRRMNLDGLKVFITHGHKYGAKSGYGCLAYRARELDADAVFFGHTHVPFDDFITVADKQIRLFNPGSVGYEGSFGVVNTSGSVLVTSHGKLS